jgi:hypothetical protein
MFDVGFLVSRCFWLTILGLLIVLFSDLLDDIEPHFYIWLALTL